ncbi:MAG: hypothetical protein WDM76_11485 [Limisphaerales bacterium]
MTFGCARWNRPPITDQLQAMVTQVQTALPGILALTNKLATVLDNAANATSNLNVTISATQPMLTNFTVISGQLREPGGVLNWALGTNGSEHVQGILTNTDSALAHTDSILASTETNLTAILIHFSDITSNLNAQVQANTNILSSISKIVVDSDDFIQGLKRHWLLRSAFKTNAPAKPKK